MKNKIIVGIVGVIIITAVILVIVNKNNQEFQKESEKNENSAKEVLNNENNEKVTSKILVVYFSQAGEVYHVGNVNVGNTAIMASYIKDYLKADSFEITPVKPYTTVYSELIKVAQEEQKNNVRPEIKNNIDITNYDTIFLGYPIWWGDLPPIVYTFLENYSFDNKTIIPFNTHEGSGSAGTYDKIKNKLVKANVNTKGLALQGKKAREDSGKEETINWLKELGY